MGEAPAEEAGVGAVDGVEGAQDGTVVEVALALAVIFLFLLFAEKEGALLENLAGEHGDEGDGRRGGDADHDGDDPAQLLHEDTHHARQHGEGHEDGHEDEGGGDDGSPHLVGGADGRFARVLAAVDMFRYILQDDDGVVDDHADGHGEGGQGDDVERAVGQEEVDEGGDEGDGDGEGDDDGGAPVAQEDEYHEDDEEEGVEDGLGESVDGVDNLLGTVTDEGGLDVGRHGLHDTIHLGTHLTGNLHGVGASLLGDDEAGAVLTVDLLVEREVLDGVAHGGEVADEDLLAGHGGGHGDVGYLGALDVFAFDAHLVLLLAHLDGAGGEVEVVGADGVADLLKTDAVGVELLGVEVDVDVALGGTADGDIADAVDAVEFVDHVVLKDAVEAGVGLLGGEAILQDRHGRGVELEDHGTADAVGQVVEEEVDIGTYVVEGLVDILAPFELEGDDGDVVLGGGGDVLQTVDAVERVLDNLGDIGLDVASVGAGVGGHDGDVGRVHLGHLVDGEP